MLSSAKVVKRGRGKAPRRLQFQGNRTGTDGSYVTGKRSSLTQICSLFSITAVITMDDDLVLNLATDNFVPSSQGSSLKKGGRWTDRCVLLLSENTRNLLSIQEQKLNGLPNARPDQLTSRSVVLLVRMSWKLVLLSDLERNLPTPLPVQICRLAWPPPLNAQPRTLGRPFHHKSYPPCSPTTPK